MGKYISLGNLKWNLAYPIIGGIAKFVAEAILYNKFTKIKNDKEDEKGTDLIKLSNHPFIISINTGLGLSLAIIPFIIFKRSNKVNNEEAFLDEELYKEQYAKNYTKSKIKRDKFLYLLLCSFSDFIQKFMMFALADDIENNIWLFDILILAVFSRLILKQNFYKHQFYSLASILIIGIVLNVILIRQSKNDKKDPLDIFIGFTLSILLEVIFCFTHVIHKYIMEYKFCTPFEIISCEGIFMIISNIILLLFSTNYDISEGSWKLLKKTSFEDKIYLDNFWAYIEEIKANKFEILVFIIHMLCRLCYYLFSVITIRDYTPSHVIILLIIGEMQFVFNDGDDIGQIIIDAAIMFFVLIMILIFIEIIELNFCGLSENIRKNIDERARKAENMELYDNRTNDLDISCDSNKEDGIELKKTKTENSLNSYNSDV